MLWLISPLHQNIFLKSSGMTFYHNSLIKQFAKMNLSLGATLVKWMIIGFQVNSVNVMSICSINISFICRAYFNFNSTIHICFWSHLHNVQISKTLLCYLQWILLWIQSFSQNTVLLLYSATVSATYNPNLPTLDRIFCYLLEGKETTKYFNHLKCLQKMWELWKMQTNYNLCIL